MIPCKVKSHYGAYLVEFDNGKSLLLQFDYDQAGFACNCGLITDDDPSNQEFIDCDLTSIEECPDEYLTVAE